jgi:hypothetical protein
VRLFRGRWIGGTFPEFDMRTIQSKIFRYCAIAACSVIVANGCMLDRRVVTIISPGQLVPAEYCPGDTMTASYDFLRFAEGGVCTPRGTDVNDCIDNSPNVTISSANSPPLFSSVTRRSYQNSVTFPAAGDRIDVGFVYRTGVVFIPPDNPLLMPVRDNTASARRITGTIDTTLPHIGNCDMGGAMPRYMPAQVPEPPRVSGNMRIVEVVNINSVPVTFTLSGGATGTPFSLMVEPGGSLRTDMPGVPSDIGDSRMISIAPIGLMCGPGGDGSLEPRPIAPPVNTLVRMACR